MQSQQAVEGSYAFVTSKTHNSFYHVIDKTKLTEKTQATKGMVTLGAWVWSNQEIDTRFPMLKFPWNNILHHAPVPVKQQPVFISAQVQIPEMYRTPIMNVLAENLPDDVEVYWDCLILVPGERSSQQSPKTSENCGQVDWDGYTGENLIRNASAERGWFPFREKIASVVSNNFYGLQAGDFWAVLDPTTSWLYYKDAIGYIFRTFWGRFNWGTLGLAGQRPYRLFVILSALAVLGNVIAVWRYRRIIDWNLLVFFLALVAADLTYTIVRFSGGWQTYYSLLPQARYFFPVILPTAFLIRAGWYALLEKPIKVIHVQDAFIYMFIGLFVLYNSWAWYSIWAYWYG